MKHTTQHFRNAIVAVLLIPAVAFAAWKFNPHTGKPDYFEVSSGNYTQEEVEDNVAALIQNGTGITWVYNDTAGTLTPTVTSGVGDMLKSVYDVDEDGKVDAIEESILAAYLTAESDPTVDSSAKIQAIIGSGIYATDGHNHSGTYEPVDATIARMGQTNAFGAFNQTFDTSTLVVDAANNRVGVGDTTPDSTFDVDGMTKTWNITVGMDSGMYESGVFRLYSYSNQGAHHYYWNLTGNSVASANVNWFAPATQPTGASFVTINATGHVGYDTATYQPYNSTLHAIANLTPESGYLHYNGTAFVYDTPSGAAHDAVTLDANAGAILSLNDQEIGLDTQTANYVWAGPVSGDAAVPAFRALVAGDIPDISATYQAANANLTTYAGITPSANAQTLLGQTFAQMQASLSIDDLITLSGVAEGSTHLATFTGSTINDNVTVKAALQALETAVEGKQATVTEGSLADSTIVSADIKDGEITAADTKITAGRSLTWSTDDIAADAELYTRMYNGGIYNVTTGDDAWVQIKPATAITISRISCSCDSGNVTIQFDERAEGTPDSAGTDVMSAALVCDTDTQSTTSFDNAGIAADALINLDIDAVGGTPTKFRFHIDYTVDD